MLTVAITPGCRKAVNEPAQVVASRDTTPVIDDTKDGTYDNGVGDIDFRIKTYWEPELTKHVVREPIDIQGIWDEVNFYELMAANLDNDRARDAQWKEVVLPPAAKAARERFRREIAVMQVKAFPKLRAAYLKLIGEKLWLNDITVSGSGRGIAFTGAIFAANANIAAAEATAQLDLRKLRFHTATYRWCRGCGGGSVYTLQAPQDRVVGRWGASDFSEVK